VLVHTDAAQSVGKIRAVVGELGVDLLTIAGHKLYAPKGIGALFIRAGIPLAPVIHGAGQEGGLRPGTENTPYIVGLGCAAMTAQSHLDAAAERMASLRDRLERRLQGAIGPRLRINGAGAERLPNTLSASFPGVVGGELLARIPELYASTGAACHSDEPASISGTLAAMRLTAPEARGTVRLSVGWYTTEEEIDRAVDLLLGAWEVLARF
jgi:cysteine desulfurase